MGQFLFPISPLWPQSRRAGRAAVGMFVCKTAPGKELGEGGGGGGGGKEDNQEMEEEEENMERESKAWLAKGRDEKKKLRKEESTSSVCFFSARAFLSSSLRPKRRSYD